MESGPTTMALLGSIMQEGQARRRISVLGFVEFHGWTKVWIVDMKKDFIP